MMQLKLTYIPFNARVNIKDQRETLCEYTLTRFDVTPTNNEILEYFANRTMSGK